MIEGKHRCLKKELVSASYAYRPTILLEVRTRESASHMFIDHLNSYSLCHVQLRCLYRVDTH